MRDDLIVKFFGDFVVSLFDVWVFVFGKGLGKMGLAWYLFFLRTGG
ncbi:hypothetical protein APED_29385 [Acanthopleuribacter pedis]